MIFVDQPSYFNMRVGRDAGYILAPKEIIWVYPLAQAKTFLASLNSTDRAQYERQLALSQNVVRTELKPLTLEDFREWYKIFDKDRISRGLGPRRIKSDWAKKLGSSLAHYKRLFFYDSRTGNLLGGAIMYKTSHMWVQFEAFKAEAHVLRLEARALDELMKFAEESGLTTIYYGPEPNMFGYHSPMSSFEFKASVGMRANWGENGQYLVKVLNPDVLNRDFVIFERHEQELNLHHFTDRPRDLKLQGHRIYRHDLKLPQTNEATQ